eukprot:TRINITY_DN7743_c0_g1_i1.p1 TRINITY_DN7743_c0_g1~~TRINITY_DN7743_c0_g1_i1.p1  ORF type:complete len:182 (-),score=24.03 TRINITY_DN7743_c0_g1_i1:163-708(-)
MAEGFTRLINRVKRSIISDTEAAAGPDCMDLGDLKQENVVVRPSNIHGLGLFATRFIPSGNDVIQYIGPVVDAQQKASMTVYEKRYLFRLTEDVSIDGSPLYNLARYINHKCQDNNCTIEHKFDGETKQIWVVAQRDIQAGEELSYSYGRKYWSGQRVCTCGSPLCFGRKKGNDSDSDLSD